jgi:PAS domain S-box-containing protein
MDVLQATKGISVFIPMHYIMIGIALCIGFQFLIIGLYRRRDSLFLIFGLMSLIFALFIAYQIAVYRATTVADMAEALRFRVAVACIFFPLFFAFVSLYTNWRARRLWVPLVSTIFAVFLVLNLLSPYSLRLSELSEIKQVSLPWGELLNIYSGSPGKWNSFYVGVGFSILVWAIWRTVVLFRAGERERAWLLGAYCALQFSAIVYDILFVDQLGIRSFYLAEFPYFLLVLLMSFYLGSELQLRTIASENAIRKLHQEITARTRVEEENRKLIHDLGERVKELTALHHMARILQHEMKSVPELLQEIVSLFPPAWQYPETTAARISFAEMEFKTSNFVATQWSQVAEFWAGGLKGMIEVIYLETRPASDIGPFLLEEKNLINSLAEMLSSALSRRYAQEALRVSEERFAKAFHASPEPISIYRHRDGILLEINERWTAVYGYSREEAVGRTSTALSLVKPEVRLGLRSLLEEQGSIRDFEIEFKTKQGEIRYISLSAEQMVINNESCDIYLHRDITERKRAEEELRRASERLQLATRAASIGIWDWDVVNDELVWDEAMYRLYGVRKEDFSGAYDAWTKSLAPEDFEQTNIEVQEALRGEREFAREFRIVWSDGSIHFTQAASQTFRDEEGRPIRMVGVNYDVTERKLAEEALRESQRRFSDTLANLEMIAVMADANGNITFCNDYLLRLTGWEREEAIGRNWFEMFIPEQEKERVSEILDEIPLEGTVTPHFENEIKTRNGERRLVKWTNTTLRDPNGHFLGVAALGDDITERKQAEEQLLASREQLRALSERLRRAKEEEGIRIAREIHDELGSALTSLKWSLLRFDKVYSGASNSVGHSNQREEIEQMVRLVDATINTVRRIASELRPGVLDDLGLVSAIEWHAQQFQEHTGIICRFDSAIDNIDLHREQATTIFRIFQEAMTNILRHAQATKVNVLIEEEEGEFVLEIRDNGRGITESEKSGTRSLGLLGMRERAHSIGGRIEIIGITGKGSVLLMRLPIQGEKTF